MIIYDNFEGLLRIVTVAVVFYAAFLVFLKISGKRATSQMNNFDWLITVSLASMLGTTILVHQVVVLEGLLAAGILLALNVGLTKVAFYARESRELLYSKPTLLFYQGRFIEKAMERERVTEDEILSAIRIHGFGDIEKVAAVVLESNAILSVLPNEEAQGLSRLLENVRGYSEQVERG